MNYIIFLQLTVPKPIVNITTIGNQTVGDKLSLRCDASVTKGITSNIHFVWKINDTEVRNLLSNATILMYTSFLNISSLNLTDNYNVYYCQAVLSTSGIASDSASVTLNVIGKYIELHVYVYSYKSLLTIINHLYLIYILFRSHIFSGRSLLLSTIMLNDIK